MRSSLLINLEHAGVHNQTHEAVVEPNFVFLVSSIGLAVFFLPLASVLGFRLRGRTFLHGRLILLRLTLSLLKPRSSCPGASRGLQILAT